MDLGIASSTAVISGGSTGIGKAAAAALLAEGAGVVLLARTKTTLDETVAELRALGHPGPVVGIQADVTDRASVEVAARQIELEFGRVQILVIAAGHRMRRLDRQLFWDDGDWAADLDVKTVGMLRVIRALHPLLDKTGAGRIVNIGGVAGETVWEGALTHGLNNAAMHHATRYLARDLAPEGITVNAVVPGLVATEWRVGWAAAAAGKAGKTTEEFLDAYLAKLGVLLGRWAESAEVAEAVAFLASQRAGYITGTSLIVDGGITVNAL
ncbi:SDR family oxidoreductase [Streptomyces sp. RLB3-17]|uniref:SDR family NAD(P)-dependent oxidoreductase n=1 Tax=unclassified Streptomyces TaxID=2593676 RepID=UPI0011636ABB|nr:MULTISPECIES: SDR family oxidoreductase [unclassified Streptomyces]NMI54299.1 SDR family oxidoreductase [Streptomyces sp. RLA2-12]QDN63112.1 SDR family oxidoreductase [Streptomyces sp. S1D4-20]QDN73164.1 SDR family oxidoreductase [Streptomyces sp. S1D4-14]QDO03874.1 SDR family oxidoreductase [Streptomyces sp. RLB1-9]QDO25605.1 SDR family oxidoreductase [Streptomyces sp. S1A1-8]